MTLQLGGGGAITGCTLLQEPVLIVSGITVNGELDASKVRVGPGTEAAPSYTFSGDTDTGLYYAGTNSIGLSTNGTNAILIDSTGNVGIGTTLPNNQLSIGGTASFETDANSFYLGSNFTGTGQNFIGSSKHAQRLFFNNASSNGYLSYANTGSAGTAGNAITWQERFRIDSSGHVAIGSTTTTTHFSVVDGSVGLELDPNLGFSSRANTGTLRAYSRASSAYRALGLTGAEILFGISDSEKMRIDSSGRLLVGTTTAAGASKLQVDAGTTNNATAGAFRNDSTSAYATTDGGINTALSISSTGTNDAQAVGIQFSLTKSGQTGAISEIGAIREGNGLSGLVFRTRDASSGRNERMRINSSGQVSIGTATAISASGYTGITTNGSVGGVLWFKSNDSQVGYLAGDNNKVNLASSNYTSFMTGGNTERMRIDSSGRLLVNTTITTNAQIVSTGKEAGNTAQGLTLFDLGSDKKPFIARGFILGYGSSNRKYSFEITGVTNIAVTTLHLTTLGGSQGGLAFSTSGGAVIANTTVYNSRAYITMLEWANINYDA